jgi:hypothetical protein
MFSDRGEAYYCRLYPHRIATTATRALAAGLVVLPLGLGAEPQSGGRVAQCRVESAGRIQVSGPCRFTAEKGGSFALENSNRSRPLFGEIIMVSVAIVSPGVAEVHGLTQSGNNSRWGQARRSKRDGACWEGADFRIYAH